MDLEKLERIAKKVEKDFDGYYSLSLKDYPTKKAEFNHLVVLASKVLPELEGFAGSVSVSDPMFNWVDARNAIDYILEFIQIKKSSEEKLKELKIFESADEKLKQAGLSFRKDDYPSVFHNLNTALELVLKDKLGIPTTITGINTSNLIDIWVKYKLEAHVYLTEARKRVLMIDNKVKHQSYSPSKIDCINGIKAMEELISRLRNKEIELTEDIRNKIYKGL